MWEALSGKGILTCYRIFNFTLHWNPEGRDDNNLQHGNHGSVCIVLFSACHAQQNKNIRVQPTSVSDPTQQTTEFQVLAPGVRSPSILDSLLSAIMSGISARNLFDRDGFRDQNMRLQTSSPLLPRHSAVHAWLSQKRLQDRRSHQRDDKVPHLETLRAEGAVGAVAAQHESGAVFEER